VDARIKDVIIKEYLKFISKLEKGYKIDYKNILDMICLVDIHHEIDNEKFIYAALAN
jgi:hypothetical protein